VNVRVVTPWRSDQGARLALWEFCQRWWEFQGVSPVEAPSPDGPFNRSAAINAGLRGSWDVAVVIDADVVGPEIRRGIELAHRSGLLVFPFTRYVGLAPWGTRAVLDEGVPLSEAGALRVVDNHESSVVIIPRRIWDVVGGFDERFVDWGQDDVAFCQSVRVLCGEPVRQSQTVYHLWHEAAEAKWPGNPLWQANQELGRRYREATTPWEMRELLWERGKTSSAKSTSGTLGTARTA
jgi:hypothetical protein